MNNKLAVLVHFIVASLVAVVLACLFHTQMVLHALRDIDIKMGLDDHLYMSFQDLVGLMPSYGSIVTIGLGISFIVAFAIRRFTPMATYYLYPIAGAIAMYTILLAMHPILEITFLAGARGNVGVAMQMVAGLAGGLMFARLRQQYNATQATT